MRKYTEEFGDKVHDTIKDRVSNGTGLTTPDLITALAADGVEATVYELDGLYREDLAGRGEVEKRQGLGYCLVGATDVKRSGSNVSAAASINPDDLTDDVAEAAERILTKKLETSKNLSTEWLKAKLEDDYPAVGQKGFIAALVNQRLADRFTCGAPHGITKVKAQEAAKAAS